MATEDIRELRGMVSAITIRVDNQDSALADHEVRIEVVEDITEKIDAIFHFTQRTTTVLIWVWRAIRALVPILTGLFALYSKLEGWW